MKADGKEPLKFNFQGLEGVSMLFERVLQLAHQAPQPMWNPLPLPCTDWTVFFGDEAKKKKRSTECIKRHESRQCCPNLFIAAIDHFQNSDTLNLFTQPVFSSQ